MTQLIVFFLIGMFIVWVIKGYRRFEHTQYDPKQFQNITVTKEHVARSELGLFVALVAKVAKADGRIDELEAELVGNMFTDISALFPDPFKAKEILKEIFKIEKQIVYNIDETALALQRLIGHDLQKRQMMMAFLVNLAYVDGHLSQAEEKMLLKIAAFLHFNTAQIDAMLRQASGMHQHATSHSSLEDAYALLGADSSDTMDVIKKKYRSLVKKYHPDIIKAQGADNDYIEQATEKVQAINAAYEMIKKVKN